MNTLRTIVGTAVVVSGLGLASLGVASTAAAAPASGSPHGACSATLNDGSLYYYPNC